jgi:hypothetical protein
VKFAGTITTNRLKWLWLVKATPSTASNVRYPLSLHFVIIASAELLGTALNQMGSGALIVQGMLEWSVREIASIEKFGSIQMRPACW